MGMYRKKPIEVLAHQWYKNGDHPGDGDPSREGRVVRYFRTPETPGTRMCQQCTRQMNDHGWIDASERSHIVCPGDWIITDIAGETYPCKPEIFEATYEEVT